MMEKNGKNDDKCVCFTKKFKKPNSIKFKRGKKMISEIGYIFFCSIAVIFFLAGVVAKKSGLTLLSAGPLLISSILSANVGDNTTGVLYTDYIIFQLVFAVFAVLAILIGVVQIAQGE